MTPSLIKYQAMHRAGLLAAFVLSCAGGTPLPHHQSAQTHGVAYSGAAWFDGAKFIDRTMYVVDGTLRTHPPDIVDSVMRISGYVVPPFADAHQHLADPRIARMIAAFLNAGVFYVKDQCNAPIMRRQYDALLNRPTSFDYVSANQGWTSPGGHPVEIVRQGAMMGEPMASFVRDNLDPGLVEQADTKADVDQRWSYFLAGTPRPDFVKVFLLTSESYSQLRSDPRAEGGRGLDPALLPYIVSLAHTAGLTVSAHVFTAADFRAAVNAGVDQIAHLPGGRSADAGPFLLTEDDGANASAHHVTVITTITQHGDSTVTDRIMKAQYAHNIDVLKRHGVPLLLGSDLFGGPPLAEVAALVRSGVFTNLELLRMWSVVTPQAIFPKRRIGVLDDGYEASFLVLGGNPLTDFSNTGSIALRVKQGIVLPAHE